MDRDPKQTPSEDLTADLARARRGDAPADLPEESFSTYDPGKAESRSGRVILRRPDSSEDTMATAGYFPPRETPGGVSGRDGAPPPTVPTAEQVSFRLRQVIGRGGFGEVWEAEQASLGRLVAVKRIRTDIQERAAQDSFESEQIKSSFRQEAFTAANLEHPNIVPIHDLGRDNDGRPVLAMKLVRGTPWDRMIMADFSEMGVDDFLSKHLQILAGVSQAVAFAHSRGIVHRDLKPSQVMVGEFDEVLLMDWGLALTFDTEVLASIRQGIPGMEYISDLTNASSPAGTPAFMAPEQTERTAARIGPWTDVFLLGGTLYYLLTGTAPYQSANSTASFYRAMSGEVQPPQERAHDRAVPPQLAALAMMAMQFETTDRVPSAKYFVDELKDYLSGSGKRRESAALTADVAKRIETAAGEYRELGELLQLLGNARALWVGNPDVQPLRERALSDFATAALANGDLVLARVQADRMDSHEKREAILSRISEREREIARREGQRRAGLVSAGVLGVALILFGAKYAMDQRAANERLQAQVVRAEKARGDAEGLINFMLEDLREGLEPIGKLDVLGSVATEAVAYYDRLPEEDRTPQVDARRARATYQVGSLRLALGDSEDAAKKFAEVDALATSVARELPNDPSATLAGALGKRGLALAAKTKGDQTRALELYRDAAARALRASSQGAPFGDWVSLYGDAMNEVGQILELRGDARGALEAYEASAPHIAEALKQKPDSAVLKELETTRLYFRGTVLQSLGKTEDARLAFRQLLEWRERMLVGHEDDTGQLRNLAITRMVVGRAEEEAGNNDEARRQYEACRDAFRTLVAKDPANVDWQRNLAVSYSTLGSMMQDARKLDEAAAAYAEFERIFRELRARDPQNAAFRLNHGVAFSYLASIAEARHEWDASHAALERMREILAPLVESGEKNTRWEREYAVSILRLARVEERIGKFDQARAHYAEAIDRRASLVASAPENAGFARELAAAHYSAAQFQLRTGDNERALELAVKAQEEYAAIAALDGMIVYVVEASAAARMRILVLRRLGRNEEVGPIALAALGSLDKAARLVKQRLPEYHSEVYEQWVLQGDVSAEAGDREEAVRHWERVVTATTPKPGAEPEPLFDEPRARALVRLGRMEEAEPIIRALLEREEDGFGVWELRRAIEK